MKQTLKLALVHLDVRHKECESNRKELVALNREAACKGADIILNTELAISGYSFESREDIKSCIETSAGETITELAEVAVKHGAYVGICLAERDEITEIYYNSAFVISPDGKIVCRYRKINAEMRWARPGAPHQNGTFETPWGRMGVLICSDTYYGLMPRSVALKGVDLLWVPANWPPGGLDPREIWRARALENGFFVAAVNRTGRDRIMDCHSASSCVYDPQGCELISACSRESRIFFTDIPLDENGEIFGILRREKLSTRNPGSYRSIYLDYRLVDDLTGHYNLPEPGILNVTCVVPGNEPLNNNYLEKAIAGFDNHGSTLFVLPSNHVSILDEASLESLAKRYRIAICARLLQGWRKKYVLATPEGLEQFEDQEDTGQSKELPFPIAHYGTAKIAMTPMESFVHPEMAVTLSKSGCDLVALSEETLDSETRLLSGVKTTERIAVAVCAGNGASVYMIPEAHQRWEEKSIDRAGLCTYELDTSKTRKKRFQERIDYDLLLRDV
jgi:predicted amidohydrolase